MTSATPGVAEAVSLLRSRAVSARELVGAALSSIERLNPALNAFVHVDGEAALAAAADIDDRRARGEPLGPLAGVPFGVKDLDDAQGQPTGKGSLWFKGGPPAVRDDLHVARLRAAGAIPVGKTAVPEFGSAGHTASRAHGVTRNPWNLERTPGGSSGGSAAAVAAGMVPFCTASDGGGSIRTPAAFTSLPGLRPSYGRVPTFGSTHVAQNAVNFALTRGVADTALLLDICSGPDPRDRTCLPRPDVVYRQRVEDLDTQGLRVAFSLSYGQAAVEPEIEDLAETAFSRLVDVAGLAPIDLDVKLDPFFDIYAKLEGVDRWIDLPDGLWPERSDELEPGLQAGWASGWKARLPQLADVYTARRRLENDVAEIFRDVDLLVTPSTGVPPFAAEGPLPQTIAGVEAQPFDALIQPVMPSVCNLPAISVPMGLTIDGLPVGLQIIASQHREDHCLRLARLMEQAVPPPVLTDPGQR